MERRPQRIARAVPPLGPCARRRGRRITRRDARRDLPGPRRSQHASRWRPHDHDHALTRRRLAVGELAADARRGRLEAGPGDCRGLSRTGPARRCGRDRCVLDPHSAARLLLFLHCEAQRRPVQRTGTSLAFRSIFSTHVQSRRSRSSASPWRTTRSRVRRCTSHPWLSWDSLSASRSRCSPRPCASWPTTLRISASSIRPEAESSSGLAHRPLPCR